MRYSPGSLIWNSEIAAFILQSNLPTLWLISRSSALECDISLCHCVFAGQAFFVWASALWPQCISTVASVKRMRGLYCTSVSFRSLTKEAAALIFPRVLLQPLIPVMSATYLYVPLFFFSFWLRLLAPSPTSPDTFFRAQQHPHPHLYCRCCRQPPKTPQPLHGPAAASLLFDEGWWRCMSGGIDNIYGGEWEWSIFLSGPVTPLAKLHHGQLPRQTPSSLLLLLLPGPHLHGYMDTLDTIIIRQRAAKRGRRRGGV